MKLVILLQQQQWRVLLLFLLLAAAASPPPPPPPISMPECNATCGNESVPYPFGFGRSECFKSSLFELNCNYDFIHQKYKLSQGDFEIVNISMENGTATIYMPMLYSCYKSFLPGEASYYSRRYYSRRGEAFYYSWDGNTSYSRYASWLGKNKSAFTVSSKQNKFTALGCSTKAMIKDSYTRSFMTGCFSACYDKVNLTEEDGGGGCSGRGCCRTQIPKGFKFLYMDLETEFINVVSRNWSPCTYAFLADQDWYDFTSIDLTDTLNVNHTSPVVVDWVVGNETCESFSINNPNPSCRVNTNCNNSYNGPGYFCSCKQGYQGNPYLGCQVIGACLSLVVVIFFLWMECKRSNKARNFSKNGGTLLKNQDIKIYKEEELKKATKNYDPDQLVGKGGFGFVYKGELLNKELVAIKKPKVDPDIARGGIGQCFRSREKSDDHNFQNEIKMICSVNHKNVVKLKGLCLETNVPLLVYEFVPNVSLFDHIHCAHSSRLNSWKNRLRIAYDTAVALDYLHSMAKTTSIIHGDVKSKNILLDENFTPKVADFGASVIVPLKQNSFSVTKVHGTLGYLDPEYSSTGRLTVKSDIYSFGVVLMELLTSQKPICEQRSLEKVDYIPYFVLSVENGNLGQVIDDERLEDKGQEMKPQIEAVAKLAVKCLNRSGLGRPDMAEVVQKLGELNARNSGVRVDQSDNIIEEKESIVRDHHDHSVDCSDNITMPSCSTNTETQYMTAFNEIQQNPSS